MAQGGDGKIALKHGAGGRAMRALIKELFVDRLDGVGESDIGLAAMDDGAALRLGDRWLVVTTDSHVISPIFFPGGDIGRLAVSGAVNDLAMMGATEVLALTCSIIVEEGFERAQLERVRDSIHQTCREAHARIVTGDTKVMGRGEIDGLVLNTTGVAIASRVVRDSGLRPGDIVIMTGSAGDHGLAVMARRHDLALEGELRSDVAPLNEMIQCVLDAAGDAVVAMKDPTRGGVASALCEMAGKARVGIALDGLNVPIKDEVRAAAELLGIDPLIVANEGKALIGVQPEAAARVLAALRAHPLGRDAAVIARCTRERPGSVILETGFGRRLLQEPEGEPLPRIC
jgi:hydrogenase expression/formation protein HypE